MSKSEMNVLMDIVIEGMEQMGGIVMSQDDNVVVVNVPGSPYDIKLTVEPSED